MLYKIIYSDELYHHGIKGQKWGIRRTPEQLGYGTTNTGKKISDDERKLNGEELRNVIKTSKSIDSYLSDDRADYIWKNSKVMKQFYTNTYDDYILRNKIYDGKAKLPDLPETREALKYIGSADNMDTRVYGYGKYFYNKMKSKASELVYDKEDVNRIMSLVVSADMSDGKVNPDTYNKYAWLYHH